MSARNWKIKLGAAGHNSTLECDGEPVKNARAITIHSAVGELTTIEVEYVNCNVELEADEVQDVTVIGDTEKRYRIGGAE